MSVWKGLVQKGLGRLTGQTDVLEAYLAGGVVVAAADGQFTKTELEAVRSAALADDVVSKLFTPDVIEQTLSQMIGKIRTARNPIEAAMKELADIAGADPELRVAVYFCMCKTASADGGVDPKEQAVLDRCANVLNLTVEDKADAERDARSPTVAFDL